MADEPIEEAVDDLVPAEVAKRKEPVKETIRHLFALSGNVCAFPGCQHTLIDAHGNFVAEVCHIEAAEKGGERFNEAMTNEERRHRDNLILMCHQHHVETDDVSIWTVEKMRELKAAHERQFEEAVERITEAAIHDITAAAVVHEPKTLTRFEANMDWRNTPEELEGTLHEMVLPMLARLVKLPPDLRAVLLLIVERGEDHGEDLGLTTYKLEQVTGKGAEDLWPLLHTLQRDGFVGVDEEPDYDGARWIETRTLNGFEFWRYLKLYCERTGLEPRAFLIDLRFDLLD